MKKEITKILPFRACTDHFARRENESGCSRFADSHDDCSKSFRIVLGITSLECNRFKLKFASEIHSAHDVSIRKYKL